METFDNLFEEILRNANRLNDTNIYQVGIEAIINSPDISVKEAVFTKLIFLFPDRTELYYFLGYIFRDVDMYKSLMWYNISLHMNHDNLECVLELMKILFDHNYLHFMYYLNEKYDNILFRWQDERMLILQSAMYIKEGRITLAEPILMNLLEKTEENPESGGTEMSENGNALGGTLSDDSRYIIYINSSFLFGKLTNIEVAMKYIKKILVACSHVSESDRSIEGNFPENAPVSVPPKSDNEYIRTAFENYSLLCDYVYTDPQERYTHCKKMNYFYPNSQLFAHPRLASHKIKIGYVSNAFQDHAVSNFILPILDNHDTERFDVYLFTHHVYKHPRFPTFNINKKTADECARLIHQLGITILIDIDGYTSGNRLDIFSKNPAPIQVTYLGFPNSTALDFVHYRLTDAVADHPESIQPYSETRLYLPCCFLLYKTAESLNHVYEPELGGKLPGSRIVLGSLNKEPKNSKEVLRTWKRILHSAPDTQLLIKITSVDNVQNRIAFYKQCLEVDEDRLIIVEFCSNEDYMRLFYNIDILLDTFPYSGTTTTCHALNASTPLVTLYHKDYHAHNVSASLLIHSGFPELVAYSEDEYVEKVVDLCNHPDKIAEYKTVIRPRFSAAMEPKQFMKEYETIMTSLYHKFLNGEPA
jgi:predicted O-linked N-acetylglucosamine transferase (SPINDLY family)